MTPPGAQAQRAPGGGVERPLDLIHRNKVPNPIGTRVSSRLAPLILRPLRRVLYLPVSAVPHLPGGPVHWLWLVRFIVDLDAPLRRAILGRALHARTD